jgi:hypothetical protein
MPWWVTNVIVPLCPAILALIIGFPHGLTRAVHHAIGQGQLFFVAAGLAGSSLGFLQLSNKGVRDGWTIGSMVIILVMSVGLYGAATAWIYQEPPKKTQANLIVIWGSIGLLLAAIYFSANIFSAEKG